MNKTLIFTATYNESKNIYKLIERIIKLKQKVDLLIVDDNSPDGTFIIIEKFSKNYKNIFLKKRKGKLGLNTAHIYAYNYALKNKYQKLITMDADLSHEPKEIPKIIELLEKHEFVIGSRYAKGGKNKMKGFRLLLSIVGNKIIKYTLNLKGTEFTSSYRGFNLKKIKKFNFNKIKSQGYSFFMETVFRLNNLGYKSYEFPINFRQRDFGKSKIPKIEIFRTLYNIFKLYFKKKNL